MQLPLETEALVVDTAGGDFKMTSIIIDELRPDEVLVEMKYSGICHTVSTYQLLPNCSAQACQLTRRM
jgi:Zn-dependent alcohol dehydrogenase